MKPLTLVPLFGAIGELTTMSWVILNLTRMHSFFRCPATFSLVAVFREAPSQSELPSSFSLKLHLDLSFFPLAYIALLSPSANTRLVTLSRSWGPHRLRQSAVIIPPWSYRPFVPHTSMIFYQSLGDCPPFYWYLTLRCLHITVMVLSGLLATHCYSLSSIN